MPPAGPSPKRWPDGSRWSSLLSVDAWTYDPQEPSARPLSPPIEYRLTGLHTAWRESRKSGARTCRVIPRPFSVRGGSPADPQTGSRDNQASSLALLLFHRLVDCLQQGDELLHRRGRFALAACHKLIDGIWKCHGRPARERSRLRWPCHTK